MAHRTRPQPPQVAAAPDAGQDERLAFIRERPDGFHWVDSEGRQEFGPFETLAQAPADMDGTETAIDEGAMSQAVDSALEEQQSQVDRGDEDEPETAT